MVKYRNRNTKRRTNKKGGGKNGGGVETKEINNFGDDKGTYTGNLEKDKREGRGIMKYKNNELYDGNWKDDKRNGLGRWSWYDTITECYWKNGLIDITIKAKQWDKHGKYEGLLDQSCEREGLGRMTYVNGDVFDGNWYDNYKYEGTMTYANGDVFEGKWEMRGKMTYVNGDLYEGDFNDDMFKNGNGKMTYANGNVYDGNWDDNNKEGVGRMTFTNSDVYDGKWKSDKQTFGKMEYSNKDMYNGFWGGDMKQYIGTMKYANGDEYHGGWFNDKKDGQGKMKYVDGRVQDGMWKNDEFTPPLQIKTTFRKNVSYRSLAYDPSNPFGPDPLKELMDENPDLVAFKFKDNFNTIEKTTLRKMVDLNNPENDLFYECREVDPEFNLYRGLANVVQGYPLLNLRSIGLLSGGYIHLEYILDVISGTNRYFLIYDPNKPILKTVVSDKILNHDGGHVSAAHCQAGQEGKLYEMSYIRDFEHNASKIKNTFKTYKRQKIGGGKTKINKKTKKNI